jgi:hypothetical protein
MPPRLDPPAATRPVGPAAAVSALEALGHPRQQAGQPSLASLLGQSLPAQVRARLADGSFVVEVAGSAWRMALPAGARPGASLPMTLVALTPQPTFSVAIGVGAPLTVRAAPALPAAIGGAQPAELSDTARLLGAVLRTAASVPGAAALVGSAPLAAGATLDPAQLAQRLQQTIAHSGLFYESHVADWAEGKRRLDELRHEPQMNARPASPLADPDSAQFVSLQLATQEQQHLAWHGQLGPGQPFDWQIDKEPPRQQQGERGQPAPPAWRSALRLRFALLGEIGATLVLRDARVELELRPASAAAATLLRAHAPALAASMDAAGTPLAALQIGAAAPGHG